MAMKRDPKMMMMALSKFKRKPMPQPMEEASEDEEETAEGEDGAGLPMDDPRNASKDGETLYIDEDLFPGNCKVGEQVKIVGTVTSLGTKIGVTPEEVMPYSENEQENPS